LGGGVGSVICTLKNEYVSRWICLVVEHLKAKSHVQDLWLSYRIGFMESTKYSFLECST